MMSKYNKCEGLDCAWCVTFCCPREYEYLKARVKELEGKLDAQFAEMEEKLTAEEMKNFELTEEIKELKDYIKWLMSLQQ